MTGSGSHLPDDSSRWPNDPFELLGVPRGASDRDLKSAYGNLIRRFKPEHAPREFRKIRDAFESAQRFATFFRRGRSGGVEFKPPAFESSDESGEATSAPTPKRPRSEGSAATATRLSHEELVASAWQEAQAGDQATAYMRLVELQARRPADDETNLRLYWLLRLQPKLDARRDAAAWLVEGLSRGRLGGRMLEAYRSHLEQFSVEAVSDRCARLLRGDAPHASLWSLAETRWRAAEQVGRLDVIPGDLDDLRERFAEEHETWFRLLLAALGYLAWSSDAGLQAKARNVEREIASYQELHLRLADELGRVDLLLETVRRCGALANSRLPAAAQLAGLIRRSWNQGLPSIEPELRLALLPLVEDLHKGLRVMIEVGTLSSAALARLCELLDGMWHDAVARGDAHGGDDRGEDALYQAVWEFMYSRPWASYAFLRPHLAVFCAVEWIAPQRVAELFDGAIAVRDVGHEVASDAALSCLFKAYRAMWS